MKVVSFVFTTTTALFAASFVHGEDDHPFNDRFSMHGDKKGFINTFSSLNEKGNTSSGDTTRRMLQEVELSDLSEIRDICDFYSPEGTNDLLPLTSVTEKLDGSIQLIYPENLYKIENAAGVTFTFSTCDATEQDTTTFILSTTLLPFADLSSVIVATESDNCPDGGAQETLTFTPEDNNAYYVFITTVSTSQDENGAEWSTDIALACIQPPDTCGPSILAAVFDQCGNSAPLQCCNDVTGAVGPACCGTVPYDPSVSVCCDGETVIDGTDESLCPVPPVDCVGVHVCGYERTGSTTIEMSHSAVCELEGKKSSKSKKMKYKSKCVANEDLAGLIPGVGYLDGKKDRLLFACGCCDTDLDGSVKDSDEDFCVNESPCDADIDNICKTDVGDRVKVNICEEKKSGKLKDTCKEPWWLPDKKDHSVNSCGECSDRRRHLLRGD